MAVTERGPGGWPVDPVAAFHEAQGKFHEARKEADHWRSNHSDLLRRFKTAQTYRDDLIESAELLRRVIDESGPQLNGDLHRAITNLLAKINARLAPPTENQSP